MVNVIAYNWKKNRTQAIAATAARQPNKDPAPILPTAYYDDCASSGSIPIRPLTPQRNFCLHPR
jgi:hypothetical protein